MQDLLDLCNCYNEATQQELYHHMLYEVLNHFTEECLLRGAYNNNSEEQPEDVFYGKVLELLSATDVFSDYIDYITERAGLGELDPPAEDEEGEGKNKNINTRNTITQCSSSSDASTCSYADLTKKVFDLLDTLLFTMKNPPVAISTNCALNIEARIPAEELPIVFKNQYGIYASIWNEGVESWQHIVQYQMHRFLLTEVEKKKLVWLVYQCTVGCGLFSAEAMFGTCNVTSRNKAITPQPVASSPSSPVHNSIAKQTTTEALFYLKELLHQAGDGWQGLYRKICKTIEPPTLSAPGMSSLSKLSLEQEEEEEGGKSWIAEEKEKNLNLRNKLYDKVLGILMDECSSRMRVLEHQCAGVVNTVPHGKTSVGSRGEMDDNVSHEKNDDNDEDEAFRNRTATNSRIEEDDQKNKNNNSSKKLTTTLQEIISNFTPNIMLLSLLFHEDDDELIEAKCIQDALQKKQKPKTAATSSSLEPVPPRSPPPTPFSPTTNSTSTAPSIPLFAPGTFGYAKSLTKKLPDPRSVQEALRSPFTIISMAMEIIQMIVKETQDKRRFQRIVRSMDQPPSSPTPLQNTEASRIPFRLSIGKKKPQQAPSVHAEGEFFGRAFYNKVRALFYWLGVANAAIGGSDEGEGGRGKLGNFSHEPSSDDNVDNVKEQTETLEESFTPSSKKNKNKKVKINNKSFSTTTSCFIDPLATSDENDRGEHQLHVPHWCTDYIFVQQMVQLIEQDCISCEPPPPASQQEVNVSPSSLSSNYSATINVKGGSGGTTMVKMRTGKHYEFLKQELLKQSSLSNKKQKEEGCTEMHPRKEKDEKEGSHEEEEGNGGKSSDARHHRGLDVFLSIYTLWLLIAPSYDYKYALGYMKKYVLPFWGAEFFYPPIANILEELLQMTEMGNKNDKEEGQTEEALAEMKKKKKNDFATPVRRPILAADNTTGGGGEGHGGDFGFTLAVSSKKTATPTPSFSLPSCKKQAGDQTFVEGTDASFFLPFASSPLALPLNSNSCTYYGIMSELQKYLRADVAAEILEKWRE